MDVEAYTVGNALTTLTFLFVLGYYSHICLRFKQYDHATDVRLALLNVAAAVIYLLSAPLPLFKDGCAVFYDAVAGLYISSQIMIFGNRVIFSFYQMNPKAQNTLKVAVLVMLGVGAVTSAVYFLSGAEMVGAMASGESACYLIRDGSPRSPSGHLGMVITVSMAVEVVGMVVIFAFALNGYLEFKRAAGKEERLTTLKLALLSFGSSGVSQVMNTLDQMNMLTGLSALRKAQAILDSIIALTLAVMVHRNIAARTARIGLQAQFPLNRIRHEDQPGADDDTPLEQLDQPILLASVLRA
ncbi:G-protein coupled receptors family 1 profile domain-containing protein [Plasmodiophora brassicae]